MRGNMKYSQIPGASDAAGITFERRALTTEDYRLEHHSLRLKSACFPVTGRKVTRRSLTEESRHSMVEKTNACDLCCSCDSLTSDDLGCYSSRPVISHTAPTQHKKGHSLPSPLPSHHSPLLLKGSLPVGGQAMTCPSNHCLPGR